MIWFFENLFYQKQCKYAMNMGTVKSGTAFNIFLVKSAIFYLCWTLPSISKITPDACRALLP